jgi:hypothetical protein
VGMVCVRSGTARAVAADRARGALPTWGSALFGVTTRTEFVSAEVWWCV